MHNVFTRDIRKIALSSNDDKRMQSIDSVDTYPHWVSKYDVWKRLKIKRINITNKY